MGQQRGFFRNLAATDTALIVRACIAAGQWVDAFEWLARIARKAATLLIETVYDDFTLSQQLLCRRRQPVTDLQAITGDYGGIVATVAATVAGATAARAQEHEHAGAHDHDDAHHNPVKKTHWPGREAPKEAPLFSPVVTFGNLVFLSGIGAHSALVAYGMNRADSSFVPGGMIPGIVIVKPDFPELKEDWPFLWFENEYVVNTGTSFMLAAAAADALARFEEKK